jgi:hypothetical protein
VYWSGDGVGAGRSVTVRSWGPLSEVLDGRLVLEGPFRGLLRHILLLECRA